MTEIKQGSVWRSRDKRETRSITVLSETGTYEGWDTVRVQSGPRKYGMRVRTLVRRYDLVKGGQGR